MDKEWIIFINDKKYTVTNLIVVKISIIQITQKKGK